MATPGLGRGGGGEASARRCINQIKLLTETKPGKGAFLFFIGAVLRFPAVCAPNASGADEEQ